MEAISIRHFFSSFSVGLLTHMFVIVSSLARRYTKYPLTVHLYFLPKYEQKLALNPHKGSVTWNTGNIAMFEFLFRIYILNISKKSPFSFYTFVYASGKI